MPQVEDGIFLRFSRKEREDAEIALATLSCDVSEDGIKEFFRKIASTKRVLNGGQTVFNFFKGKS